ncbi:hypothetical protein RGR602_CH02282 [Rhizobium gallicum bv. gallicum R602sp]|uniref:Uncharacterized protein n=1 Tax=Rhizobium gallicum bv. gallicum R602sp TaxID=1041138 RepID=A0A0B4X109_9HYPH|nr:hypothetical protein RGR602_CH02282 [Rhizobium gallicum bv. gallicum R602sp]
MHSFNECNAAVWPSQFQVPCVFCIATASLEHSDSFAAYAFDTAIEIRLWWNIFELNH